ncbi:MAG TPA: Crp/Fnr family transcriptional regulator [Candidatus Limnocylindrales bacterium]|nr:Crp/Fnr family transcriptional regulator [Candidatus Limnocylindrales bacterium]
MTPTQLGALRILRRDPVHRLPGCWYVQDSRMLHNLDQHTVDAMAHMSTTASYAPGQLLHEAGEPMDAVAFISSGRVKVYRVSRDGKQQTIVLLGPGDAFGEIGMVDHRGQDLYVEALEQTTVCRTTRDGFLRIASRDPALALRLAEAMGEKLQDARERIADFAFRDIRGRVANLVLTFLERERRLSGDPQKDRLSLGLTHRELADLIGTRRESVTLALNALERDALLRIEDHIVVVADEEELRQIAET